MEDEVVACPEQTDDPSPEHPSRRTHRSEWATRRVGMLAQGCIQLYSPPKGMEHAFLGHTFRINFGESPALRRFMPACRLLNAAECPFISTLPFPLRGRDSRPAPRKELARRRSWNSRGSVR